MSVFLVGKMKVTKEGDSTVVKIGECSEEDDDEEDEEEEEDDDSESEEDPVGAVAVTEVVYGPKAGTDQEVPNIVLR